MTEEHTQYTVSGLLIENELLRERVEALRKTVDGFSDASSYQWWAYRQRIDELEQTVQRLEADNRRLRKLDAMPLDALRRYWEGTTIMDSARRFGYSIEQYELDNQAFGDWLDGDA